MIPKLLTALKAIETRLKAIDGSGDFFSEIGQTVYRGQRTFNEDELPVCACYLTPREPIEEQGERMKVVGSVVIEAHMMAGESPEDDAIYMLADIQRAIELADDKRLGGVLYDGLVFEAESIAYPSDGSNVVSCSVSYSLPTVRHYGDPIK